MSELGGEFSGSRVRRAWEPPEEVIVSRAVAHSPILQPEDYGVLIRLLLRDPGLPSTMKDLVREFQASGWKMGETRLAAIFKRLKKAGHVKHAPVYNPATGRPEWMVEVYRNPANNEQYVNQGAAASLQVRAETEVSTGSNAQSGSGTVENGVSAGQSETVETSVSNAEPWIPGSRNSTVSPGQSRNRGNLGFGFTPPTPPPEEVETSSPSPHTGASASHPSQTEGEEGRAAQQIDPALIASAAEFLSDLPDRWACGRKTVRDLSPLLAEVISEQGWEIGPQLLVQLTQNPGGIRNFPATLKSRIEDLPRFRRAAARQAGPVADPCPHHPGRERATCVPCRSVPDLDVDPQPVASEPDPEHVRAAEEAKAQIMRGIAGRGAGGKTARAKTRTRAGREAAAQASEAEFERKRAEALAALEALEQNNPAAGT
ncbi:hypothetical protein [Streptomyces scabiei]|uniref:hypothetical protein n=1 Tax=Streptomyces scabiei TaxID=1930 RepID=UPI0029B7EA37|nr:hypothetical protein [Streptomyces scabiei]MDX2567506.1 hypothetical protein [Streptomyces scabiei]